MRIAMFIAPLALVGCMDAPRAAPAEAAPAAKAAPAAEATPAEPATAKAPANADPKIPELSAEDLRLIEANPEDLSPEDRRKRGYALRRKVMQNPDSPAARALNDMAEAVRNGQVDPGLNKEKEYPTLYLPGTEPKGGSPPAGYRPPAESGDAKAKE